MRERKSDFSFCRGVVQGIIREAAQASLSHKDILALRHSRLFLTDAWKRLAASRQQELLGMLRGAEDAWLACGAIVWTHVYCGVVVLSQEDKYDVSAIDTTQSKFRWRSTMSEY